MLCWSKRIVAIILLPLCFGTSQALIRVLVVSGEAQLFWVAFLGGAACWLVVFLLLPKPIWVYVLGHEFTHAIWVWLFGGSVKRIKISSSGGFVVLTRSNFIITLAPYFFPLYAILVLLVFGVGHWVWNWSRYRAFFHFALGVAYAFHATLTVHVLRTPQSDIEREGFLFSGVIIWLGNVGVLLVAIPLVTGNVDYATIIRWSWEFSRAVVVALMGGWSN